jgi:hypothetical protein
MGQNRRWRPVLWLWRGTRYGESPVMQGLPQKCTLLDLWLANKKGIDVAQYWANKIVNLLVRSR